MSIHTNIEKLRNSGDSARGYKWDIVFNKSPLDPKVSDLISLRARSLTQPQQNNELIETNIKGFTLKEHGAATWNELTLTILEVDNYLTMKAIYELISLGFNPRTGIQAKKKDYECSIDMHLLNLEDVIQLTWKLRGAFFQAQNPPDLSSEKTEVWAEYGVILHYDYAELA